MYVYHSLQMGNNGVGVVDSLATGYSRPRHTDIQSTVVQLTGTLWAISQVVP